nr:protein-export chaperone SecB [Oceanococcus sp. HetDA_MAG_MS8]
MSTDTNSAAADNGAAPAGPRIQLQKVYLKDASVEVPSAPQIFTKAFQPKIDVNLNTEVSPLGKDTHQVLLAVTVTAKHEDEVAYLVELQMAGILAVQDVRSDVERQAILGAWAPNNIFPFLREAVNDLVQKAGFPPFLLQPVNFDAALREHLQKNQTAAQPGAGTPAQPH